MLEAIESTPSAAGSRVLTPHEARIERGEPIGLVGDAAQSKRGRIQRMLEGFRDTPIQLNLDRARLLTESMKATEGQPMVLRWGKALAHILENHPIHIEEEELLVGSAGPPGRYAVVYCELVGPGRFYTHPHELAPSKPGEPITITEDDVTSLNEEILPYWERNAYHRATMNALPEETRRLMERIFVVTPTAAGRSMLAWAHDYGKVLERGIGSIRREAAKRLEALDPIDTAAYVEQRPFLEAVCLVCDAMVAFAHRYAALARSMAAEESRAERRRELLEIADICERVPEHPARSFREAVQSQWFVQTVSRLEQAIGGVVGNGRIDQYLYPYYRKGHRRGAAHRRRGIGVARIDLDRHGPEHRRLCEAGHAVADRWLCALGSHHDRRSHAGRPRREQRAFVSDPAIEARVPSPLSGPRGAHPCPDAQRLSSCHRRNHQGWLRLSEALLRRRDHPAARREGRHHRRSQRLLRHRLL